MGVTDLSYRVDDGEYYSDAEPVECDSESGTFQLHQGLLRVTLRTATATIAEARGAVEPYLRAWELEHALRTGIDGFRFMFAGATSIGDVPDVDEHPPEPLTETADRESSLIIRIRRYPNPPEIRVTDEMLAVWRRYSLARIGIRESLLVSAYYPAASGYA
jgi:hypothetical protein